LLYVLDRYFLQIGSVGFSRHADSTQSTAVAPKTGRPYIDIVKLFAALNHPTRWRMVEVLGGGRAMSEPIWLVCSVANCVSRSSTCNGCGKLDCRNRAHTSEGGQLFLRYLSEMEGRPLSGATGAVPFFSPDGESVGFFSVQERALKKIAITGGAAVSLCRPDTLIYGAQLDGRRHPFW